MDAALRELVRARAKDCCEYCQLPQLAFSFARFHVDHIIALQHGGTSEPANLAWACFHCNVHKGTNLTAIDPVSGQVVPVFDPRQQVWSQHFMMRGDLVMGISPTGRATANLLQMNVAHRVEIRRLLD